MDRKMKGEKDLALVRKKTIVHHGSEGRDEYHFEPVQSLSWTTFRLMLRAAVGGFIFGLLYGPIRSLLF